jgi:hypothetical protein
MGYIPHAHIRQIQKALRERQLQTGDPNFIAIGLGKGMRGNKLDKERPLVVQYAVREKLENPKSPHRVKGEVTVSLRTSSGHKKITLPTDVIEIGKMVPTSAPISSGDERFSGGYLVSWMQPNTRWGVLTVGHGLHASQSAMAVINYGHSVTGRVLGFTSPDDAIDAGLVEIASDQVQQLFGPAITTAPAPLYYRSFTQLVSDTQNAHATCTMEVIQSVAPFQLTGYFTEDGTSQPLVPDLPGLKNIFFGQSTQPQVFRPGVSGAAWLVVPHISAAMQVAGNDSEFNHGFGVSIDLLLRWAANLEEVQGLVQLRAML